MTPKEFLEQVVRPNRADLDEDFGNLRLGFNAVMAVNALPSHIFWTLKDVNHPEVQGYKCDDCFGRAMAKECAPYKTLRAAANAQKHAKLRSTQEGINRSSDIDVNVVPFGCGPFGRGRFGGPNQIVISTNGTYEFVESLLDESIAFFEGKMSHWNLT